MSVPEGVEGLEALATAQCPSLLLYNMLLSPGAQSYVLIDAIT